jgi:hypothetical protein
MKFKVGDKAKIRKDLIIGETYSELHLWEGDMARQRGETVTITDACDYSGICSPDYAVAENEYYWGEEMLEPAPEEV